MQGVTNKDENLLKVEKEEQPKTENVSISEISNIEVNEVETVQTVEEHNESNNIDFYNSPINAVPTSVLSQSNSFKIIQDTADALVSMQTLASVLVKGNLCPLKKEADVIIAMITGNQLGLPFMTSVNNIYCVNGKPSLSAHLHRALLLQNKVFFEKINDYAPLYDWAQLDDKGQYVTQAKDINGTIKQVPVILKRATVKEKPLTPCVASHEVDRVTTYHFSRFILQPDNSYKELKAIGEFKMSDAHIAGLLVKDNWKNYPNRMCDARAFVAGAREIASDITMGLPCISELADSTNVNYTINASLEEQIRLQ
jgi:hypothetical protein